MAFNIKNSLIALQSHIASTGYVNDAAIGEPTSPPIDALDKVHAAVYMASASVVELTLSTTTEVHVAIVRLYKRAAFTDGDDSADVEQEMAMAVSEITSNFIGEFDLGSTIRAIDVGGTYGSSLTATWGYVNLSQVIFRIVDIQVPIIVDGSATQAA